MNNPTDFKLTLEGVIAKLPPVPEASAVALQAMCDYIEKSDVACSADRNVLSRTRLLDRAQVELIQKLEALCDTELPDVGEQVQPATTIGSQSPRLGPGEEPGVDLQ